MGLSLSGIFLVYTGESVARVFFISAGTFAATSLYGYTTRRDLTRFGSFLFMGLIGIIIAGLVNMFLKSSTVQLTISAVGVIVFVGLTAYDTQRIKALYIEGEDGAIAGKQARSSPGSNLPGCPGARARRAPLDPSPECNRG